MKAILPINSPGLKATVLTTLGIILTLGLAMNCLVRSPADSAVSISVDKINRHRLQIHRFTLAPSAGGTARATAHSAQGPAVKSIRATHSEMGKIAVFPEAEAAEDRVFELKELYDRNLLKVISRENPNYDIDGLLAMEGEKISDVSAHIGDFHFTPMLTKGEVAGDYNYQAKDEAGESIMGKIQATLINPNELNLYFISGLYRGYTLIFSLKLSDGQAFEQAVLAEELRYQELSQGNSDLAIDIVEAEQDAIAERHSIAEQTRAMVEQSAEDDQAWLGQGQESGMTSSAEVVQARGFNFSR